MTVGVLGCRPRSWRTASQTGLVRDADLHGNEGSLILLLFSARLGALELGYEELAIKRPVPVVRLQAVPRVQARLQVIGLAQPRLQVIRLAQPQLQLLAIQEVAPFPF